MAKPGLGRGLGALLSAGAAAKSAAPVNVVSVPQAPATTTVGTHQMVRRVPLDSISPCPLQPRKDFAPEALRELADSIQAQGIVQPLVVRERDGRFELIAGERRWRAAQLLKLKEVPIIIRVADDRAVLELALIENLQRENLNAIEEAQGYSQLLQQFRLTQEEIATKVGKSRAAVANSLRLLKLSPTVQDHVRSGRLSVGHAKVILSLPDPAMQESAADKAIKAGLNVRQTEVVVSNFQNRLTAPTKDKVAEVTPARDPHVASLEDRLRERLGTKVRLKYEAGKGALEIAFFSDAELERVLDILGVENS